MLNIKHMLVSQDWVPRKNHWFIIMCSQNKTYFLWQTQMDMSQDRGAPNLPLFGRKGVLGHPWEPLYCDKPAWKSSFSSWLKGYLSSPAGSSCSMAHFGLHHCPGVSGRRCFPAHERYLGWWVTLFNHQLQWFCGSLTMKVMEIHVIDDGWLLMKWGITNWPIVGKPFSTK